MYENLGSVRVALTGDQQREELNGHRLWSGPMFRAWLEQQGRHT